MTKPKAYQQKKRKPIIVHPNEYPRRFSALGKSHGSKQGVAGWRHNYHRLDERTRNSGDFLSKYLDSLNH